MGWCPWKNWKRGKVNKNWALELSLKWLCLHPVFGPSFTPYPLFHWYPQSKDILINLTMKCWYSAFNARVSRLIIVVVQLTTVKIYVAAVEALRKKGRQDETQFTPKIDGFLRSAPLDANVLLFQGFFESHLVHDQTRGFGALFSLLYG